MIRTIEVKIDEVKKFDELDPREPIVEQHREPVEELTEVPLLMMSQKKLARLGQHLLGSSRKT